MSEKSVAVVIPARDAEATLEACLRSLSVFTESGAVEEIVVVDDGSRDATKAIAESLGARLVQSPRPGGGAGMARNAGWITTSADYVWFLDSDCEASPGALGLLRAQLEDPDVGAAAGSYLNALPQHWLARRIQEEIEARHADLGSRTNVAASYSLLCRRQALEDVGGFDQGLLRAQDTDFSYRLRSVGWELAFCSDSLVAHHHHHSLASYARTQFWNAFWRLRVYRSAPRKLLGDGYSTWLDHTGPVLVMVLTAALSSLGACSVASTALGWNLLDQEWSRRLLTLAAATSLALVATTLPLAIRIASMRPRRGTHPATAALYHVAISVSRSFVHALGAASGIMVFVFGTSASKKPTSTAEQRSLESRAAIDEPRSHSRGRCTRVRSPKPRA